MNAELNEIYEKLEDLEEKLIQYEEGSKTDSADISLVHLIFRYAHNLKSTLAMAGKEHSSHLIHALENNFDQIRNGTASPTPELFDKCFTAIDIIKKNVQNEKKEDIEITKQTTEELNQICGESEGNVTQSIKLNFPLNKMEMKLLETAKKKNMKIYQVEKLMKSDISKENFHSLPIYQDINDIGFQIASTPKFDDIQKNEEEFILRILFASEQTKDDLYLYIFDPFKEVSVNAESPELKKEKKPLRILIVEDEFINRRLLTQLLSRFGGCDVAVNGTEAIESFKLSIEENKYYDLICLDIMMPGMDGQEVLKKIRDMEKEADVKGLSRVKVIMTTALSDSSNVFEAFRSQADGYIVKPITTEKIENQLKKIDLV